MSTTVTVTIADADVPRIVNAITSPSQLQSGSGPPFFPPTGSTNALTIKAWVTNALQQATVLHEAQQGPSDLSAVPAIT